TAGTKADTTNITVFGGPDSILISPRPVTIAGIGKTQELTAVVKNRVGTVITAPVTWTSRDTKIATVSTSGVATAIAVGTTRIVAGASATVLDSVDVTVTAGPASGVAINAGNNQTDTVGKTLTIQPSVVIKDADGNLVKDGTAVTFAVTGGGGAIVGS